MPSMRLPFAACLSLLLLAGASLLAQRPEQPYVIMVSIDGLKPSTYTSPGPAMVPTLRALARSGAWAEGVIGVTPTVTYPSHTTLVTGVLPAEHGIVNNLILDPEGTSRNSWYWYARDVRVPTLPGAVKSIGLPTASIIWPATVDADIDYLVPEFGGATSHPKWLDLLRALSRPRLLLDAYEAQGAPIKWPMADADSTALAAWVFRTYRPHLLLLHIFDVDGAEHTFGPGTPQALAAIEKADAQVKVLVDAAAAAGLQQRTNIVVVSDHGFLPTETELRPNFALKNAGLIDVDEQGRIRKWDAYFHGAGGSGFIFLSRPDDAALKAKVGDILKGLAADPANGIQAVWEQADLQQAGADPQAVFGIDMKDTFYSSAAHDRLLARSGSRGGHGFGPTRTALHASLVMSGPNVGAPGSLGVIRMTQIAPTIASWFGVGLSPKADAPLTLQK